MGNVETWGQAITASLIGIGERFLSFLPTLLGALLVFLAGWAIASSLGKLVEKAMKAAKVDKAIDKMGLAKGVSGAGMSYGLSALAGGLVKWFLILVFLMAATDILDLIQVTNFLNSIIIYLPNVIVAVVILAFVILLGNFVQQVVRRSTKAAGVTSAALLAAISKWAIIVFGIFAALIQLGVASSLVNTLFIGFIAMVSLAGGLAFGLGGKDEARLILGRIREEVTGGKNEKKS